MPKPTPTSSCTLKRYSGYFSPVFSWYIFFPLIFRRIMGKKIASHLFRGNGRAGRASLAHQSTTSPPPLAFCTRHSLSSIYKEIGLALFRTHGFPHPSCLFSRSCSRRVVCGCVHRISVHGRFGHWFFFFTTILYGQVRSEVSHGN